MTLLAKNLLMCSKACKKKPYYVNIKGKWKIQTPMLGHVTYVGNKQQVGNTSTNLK